MAESEMTCWGTCYTCLGPIADEDDKIITLLDADGCMTVVCVECSRRMIDLEQVRDEDVWPAKAMWAPPDEDMWKFSQRPRLID